jgi:hypothetical protein
MPLNRDQSYTASTSARARDPYTIFSPSPASTVTVSPNRLSATLINVRSTAPIFRSPEIRLL